MKKVKLDELRSEYHRDDLGPGVRGKYFESYRRGTNLILLSPDVAKAFPTEDAVNDALRSLIEIARKSTGLTLIRPPVVNREKSPETKKK
jgi:hypothetical protein